MSNYGCKSEEVGGYEGETYQVDLKKEMEALKNQFELYAPGTEGYGTDPNLTVYKNQSLVNESNVEMGKTIVYISDGDIEINHDILYPTAGYQTIQQIPKMVIFAKNVNIGCNVQQLDALIWAEGNVSTCDGQTPITSDMAKQEKYKNQLVVNGAIVAGSITLNRAYGAGSGKDSLTPAELFNYDSSLYLWSYSNAEAANSGQMTETSLIELAPRY